MYVYRPEEYHLINQEVKSITNDSGRPLMFSCLSGVLAKMFNPSPIVRKQSENPRLWGTFCKTTGWDYIVQK